MSVTVRHLNGDSTFLLIFSAEESPTPSDLRSANGAFSVLIDPWIVGSSVTTAPWFAITHRIEPSSIEHLSQLEDEPDVVLCSQNKTDHTNKQTLLQLRPEGKTLIIAEPAAAKTIKSWNYFDQSRIRTMTRFDARSSHDNILRLVVPPLTAEGEAGLVTFAFVPARNYVTGLHNAFGITYQPPPTKTKSSILGSMVDLSMPHHVYRSPPRSLHAGSDKHVNQPFGNPSGHSTLDDDRRSTMSQTSKSHAIETKFTASSQVFPLVLTPSEEHTNQGHQNDASRDLSFFEFTEHKEPEPFSVGSNMLTPPASPGMSAITRTSSFSTASSSRISAADTISTTATALRDIGRIENVATQANRSKTMSIIYSPHGLPLHDLQPYIRNHLVRLPGALPLTLLLHSFDYTENPWYLGGNITTGAEGGMQIAKALMAKCWISAHDAEKEKQGVAVKLLRMRKTNVGEVQQQLSHDDTAQNWSCDIRCLEVGQEIRLSQSCPQLGKLTSAEHPKPITSTSSSNALAVPPG